MKRLNFQLQLPGAQPSPPVQVKYLPKHPLYRQTCGEGRGAWYSTVFILFLVSLFFVVWLLVFSLDGE